MVTSQGLSEIKNILEKDNRIVFAYLFGSVAEGKQNKLSDIDIAVYIDNCYNSEDVRTDLILSVSDIFKTFDVDIVILNQATPVTVFSVIRTGKLLISKDEGKRVKFIQKNLKEFLDMEYYRRRFYRSLSQRIEGGRFGI